MGMLAGVLGHVHIVESLEGAAAGVGGRAVLNEALGHDHIVLHGHLREKVEILKHHTYSTSDKAESVTVAAESDPENVQVTGGVGFDPVDTAQEGGLARAGRTDQRQNLTLADREIDLVERLERAVPLADLAAFDHRRGKWRQAEQISHDLSVNHS